MKATHTPGPWRIGQERDRIVAGANGLHIAQVATQGMGFAADANAALIVASPKLLKALKAIVNSLADQDDEGLIEHAQQMIDARAAIAEAEGRA